MRAVPLYVAVNKSVQSVVATHADIFARVDFCAALAQNDVARNNVFTAELLDAATL